MSPSTHPTHAATDDTTSTRGGDGARGGEVPLKVGNAGPGDGLGWRWLVLCTSLLGVGWSILTARAPAPVKWVDVNAPHVSKDLAEAVGIMLGATVVTVALLVLRGRAQGRRQGAVEWRRPLRAAELELRPLAALPWVAFAMLTDDSILGPARMLSVAVAAWLLASSDWGWLTARVTPMVRAVGEKRAMWAALTVAYVAAVVHLVHLANLRIDSLNARTFDLGIYDNILFNTLHGNFLGCSMIKGGVHTSAHFDPILGLLAPIYALAPGARTVVMIQAVWVLSGAFPATLIARRSVGRAASLTVGLAWLAYPSVHGIVLHDMHSYALMAPLLMWMVLLGLDERWRAYAVVTLVTLTVREDTALCVMGVGAWLIAARMETVRGVMTIAVAAAYLAIVKFGVMPDSGLLMQNSDEVYAYANRYRRLIPEGGGARDAALTVATNPAFLVGHVITRQKIASAVILLVPLAGLPLLGRRRLVLAVWGTAFIYLASKPSLSYPLVHYTSALYPALFAALPVGMATFDRWLARRPAGAVEAHLRRHFTTRWVLASALLAGCSWGVLRENRAFALHTDTPWSLTDEQRETLQWLEEKAEELPASDAVTASNRLGPFFSARREMYLPAQREETPWLIVHREDLGKAGRRWVRGRVAANEIERVDGLGPITLYRRVDAAASR